MGECLAPLGALVFDGARAGVRWFVAFVAVFLVSGIVGELAGGGQSPLADLVPESR